MKTDIVNRELLNLIKKDNTEAFYRFYKSFFAPLCVFAARYLEDSEMRKDCVQEVFLNIWKDRKTLHITGSVKGYLFTAVKNRCLNVIQKEKLELTYEQHIMNKYDPYTEHDLYSIKELEQLIRKAIDNLPERYRTTFLMSRFMNMTYKQIADKQQISIKTVEAHISKALLLLSKELKDYYPASFLLFFLN